MEHVCTEILFRFWDGKSQYTVMYSPSLRTWFVFEGDKEEGALAKFPLPKNSEARVNPNMAARVLEEYQFTKEHNIKIPNP